MQIRNFHCGMVCDILATVAEELLLMQSKDRRSFLEADVVRLESYVKSLDLHCKFVSGHAPLDLPHTNPKLYNVLDFPAFERVKNLKNNALFHMMAAAYQELSTGESAIMGSGFGAADKERVGKLVEHLEAFLAEVIRKEMDVDMPDTTKLEVQPS